jgi:hypothetical protein
MGWKSTVDIKRSEALTLIIKEISSVHSKSNTEIADMLETLGYGDDPNKEFHGYNFNVVDDEQE